MNPATYDELLAQEAEVWNRAAEELAATTPPDWRYHRELRHIAFVHERNIEALLLHVKPGMKTLELGCGSGWLTVAMAERGAIADGIDIADRAITIARSYYESHRKDIMGSASYQVADLNRLGSFGGPYDLVAAKGILHHLLTPDRVIPQIYDALKPDGLLWISDTCGRVAPSTVLLAGVVAMASPTFTSYAEKGLSLLRFGLRVPDRVRASMEADGLSPFEGAGRMRDWLKPTKELFVIERQVEHPAFTGYIAAQLRMPDRLALPLLRLFYALDIRLVRLKLLRSSSLTLYARKPARSPSRP